MTFKKNLIERFIKLYKNSIKGFIEYSPYLIILCIIILISGGFVIFLLEDNRLYLSDAYWTHLYAFFGNEPSNLSNPLSKLFIMFTSFLGLIVLPAATSIILTYYQKIMERDKELEQRIIIGLKELKNKHPNINIEETDKKILEIFEQTIEEESKGSL